MTTLQIPTAEVFLPLLEPRSYKGARGGRGSGKSHFFAGALVERALEQTGLRWVCVREVQGSLKQSSKRLVEDTIRNFNVAHKFRILDDEIRTPGGGLIIFQGMQNHTADSMKSLEGYDGAWVDEAQALSQVSLSMLYPTIRKTGSELWFSWNPRSPKDPVDAFFRDNVDDPDFVSVEVNYFDNPWFPDKLRADMERDRSRDPGKYAHIWLGHYQQRSEARVFTNWQIDEFDTPESARFYLGGDWGFSVDPSVLVRCWIKGRTLYVDHEAYKVGCEIDHLPALFAGSDISNPPRWENPFSWAGVPGAVAWPIVGDSARPETISYLAKRGFNIRPARKGAGSVQEGVEFLRSYDIVVHPRCRHTIDELTSYAYKVDKRTDEVLPVLKDSKNHVIDSLRYAIEGLRRAPPEAASGSYTVRR